MIMAALTHNDATNDIYLPDGSILTVVPSALQDFIAAAQTADDFTNWHGSSYWSDDFDTMDDAIKSENVVAVYHDNGTFEVLDEIRWNERLQFYKIA